MRSRFAVHIKLGISSLSIYEGHLVSNEWWENPEAVLGEKGMRERVIIALVDKIYRVLRAWHCFKVFTFTNSFNPHSNLVW